MDNLVFRSTFAGESYKSKMSKKITKGQLLESLRKVKAIKSILKLEKSDEVVKTKLKEFDLELYCPTLPNLNRG